MAPANPRPIAGIVNTTSRSPRSKKTLAKRIAWIRAHPMTKHTQLFFTAQVGDAENLARNALLRGFDTILSIGGDGTHNEVVNGFFDRQGKLIQPSAWLAVFPGGTGGDFRKALGIGRRLSHAVNAFQKGRVRAADVGIIRYRDRSGRPKHRRFINIASVGLGGLVDRYVADSRLHWFGGLGAYGLATLKAFLRFRNPQLRIRIDQEPAILQRACALVVANGRFFGGGMQVAPRALVDDGRFDVVCLGDFGLKDFLLQGHRIYRGSHLALPNVWMRRARRVRVDAREPVPVDVDGEAAGCTPVEITIASERINVLTADSRCFSSVHSAGQG